MLEFDIRLFKEECNDSLASLEESNEKKDEEIERSSSDDEMIEIKTEAGESIQECKERDSKLIDDSLLLPFNRPSEVGSSLADILACQIEKRGVFSRKRRKTNNIKKRKKFMNKLNIAPAEGNTPQDWLGDIHLEEKSFPHMFPSGWLVF